MAEGLLYNYLELEADGDFMNTDLLEYMIEDVDVYA